MGSLTAPQERFMRWRNIDGETNDPLGAYQDLETLIRGLFDKETFLNFIRYFSIFEDNKTIIKKVAGYHQFYAVQKALEKSGKKIEEIDAVASTAGPGLIVCLSVGLSFGKAFASSINKPFIAVNHLEGHALSPKLNSKLDYPYLLL